MKTKTERVEKLKQDWSSLPRWEGIERPYSAEEVVRISGSVEIEHTLAKLGAEKFWTLLHSEPWVSGLGALTGNQAVQEVTAGMKAIYLSGWQVAADANLDSNMYPDQSLYPVNSVPAVAKSINNALLRRDQIEYMDDNLEHTTDWMVPIIADAEAGFGGNLNAFELMKRMIEAGVAGVHFEDQDSSSKKCGHMGGKVLVPTQTAINKLIAARLAADVCGTSTLIIARTDADSATLLTSDIDPRDAPFILSRERTPEGFFKISKGLESAVARGLAYAPYADLLWMETGKPDVEVARKFAEAIHAKYPGKLLAYNCSPSFNWSKYMSVEAMKTFREEIAALGFKFQFITLAGFHALNTSMFELSKSYLENGMAGFSELQQKEFGLVKDGFQAVTHQAFVGTGYFDAVQKTISQGASSTCALVGSTEEEQFHD